MAFFIFITATFFTILVLKIYTRHNHNLTVPDFRGLTLEEASRAALIRDLRVQVFDSVYINEFERGTVADQHPLPSSKVKKDRMIFLTMNAVNPERVVMPNLIDLTLRQAHSRLESMGLKLGNISYEPDLAVNVVLRQRIDGISVNPGDSIIKGMAIDLVLGQGLSNERTGIPELRGLTYEQARLRASDRFLSIGAVVPDNTIMSDEEQENAFVIRQRPEPETGESLPLGSLIDIWLTLDTVKLQETLVVTDTLNLN